MGKTWQVSDLEERDPEVEDAQRGLERLLEAGGGLRGPSYDAHLAVVEAAAAPHAISFLIEIRRLDELLRNRPC